MKFLSQLLLVMLAIILFYSISFASNIKTYRNDKLGFEVSFLENWEHTSAVGNPSFSIKRKSIFEPGTISISVKNFTGNKKQFMRMIKTKPQKFTEGLKRRFPDAEMIAHGDTVLGGFPAYYLSNGYTVANLKTEIDIVNMQILCIRSKKIYLITFETKLTQFEKLYNEFDAMMASFNFR